MCEENIVVSFHPNLVEIGGFPDDVKKTVFLAWVYTRRAVGDSPGIFKLLGVSFGGRTRNVVVRVSREHPMGVVREIEVIGFEPLPTEFGSVRRGARMVV